MPKVKKADIAIGMKVTCRRRVEAYYSRYAGNIECWFEVGEVGTVGAVDVPCVHGGWKWVNGGTDTFVCVDFEKHGRTWRCSLYYTNIKVVHEMSRLQ